VKTPGYLDGLEISREEAEAIVMRARVSVGWVDEADLAPHPAEGENDSEAEEGGEPAQ
jgi:N utilization substance protein A